MKNKTMKDNWEKNWKMKVIRRQEDNNAAADKDAGEGDKGEARYSNAL